ncbi:uncharacterized protein FOMMEDRAFT_19850 [Fomitiporia mediterranea MF3/22]|uniref:uncharacterized protein n=1 Tax=Fomitiporia mediterranea (strain MF3/22) TaxID=694068 RepID=UPI000440972F|nr:uncharacterized protein FOMMEDRAFT_19850 [Fomitiporia mediterranea MF3/22]EJD04630.1 hypothetical protein FOMMEDRAFT_19850 [Fomitiporia mediterranea MF3/22]
MNRVRLSALSLLFATQCIAGAWAALLPRAVDDTAHSLNVSTCPGYTLQDLQNTSSGFTASLALAGPACNAFGNDIANLTIAVDYESQSRLHVHIFDTANQQFQIPESVITRPSFDSTEQSESDLEFHYNSAPFEFWITRRSDSPDAAPLFDTRKASLPPTPVPPLNAGDNRTAFDGFSLVFEDQYLQLTSALPLNTNIYGLGEAVASSGIRRDVGVGNSSNGGLGTIQTMWARDVADPIDGNMYGMHAVYMEHRFDESTASSKSHGVFLLNSAGSDILLSTPPSSNTSLVQYRAIGGTLDLYFLSGPSPKEVVQQYGEVVGLPTWQPYWGFGFHLCRWGYTNVSVTREQVTRMREANIPLEVQWNDIDLYHAFRDFTTDPVSFPTEEVRAFIQELASNNQHYIPIVDAALAKTVNTTDVYDPYTSGTDQKVFITNSDGSEYVGQVWPGFTVFPDWFANNTVAWWTEAFKNWSTTGGVEFSGIWLDMNEPSSFCDGSCGSNRDITNTSTPFILPGKPGNPVTDYPEGYISSNTGSSLRSSSRLSKLLLIQQRAAFASRSESDEENIVRFAKRGLGAGSQSGVDLNSPPYAIHNGAGRLSINTVATNASSAPGYAQLDIHNLFGMMEERATHLAVQDVIPGKRPFLIARSTFPSSGKWSGHWLGDNFSQWLYMHFNIQGVLQFQMFQIPMVGADTCGFNGNTDEELCNRWMQLSAFVPFYRNHNTLGAISQEPYRWDSVANASRIAMAVRYSMLPYWYTLFANVSTQGTPPVRALFWEFPDESELFAVDRQFLVGRDILVTPVLEPNATTVDGIFPGRGSVTWRDWYTHSVVNTSSTSGNATTATLPAPLGHINVHVRDGAILLLHAKPAYTTTETRAGPFELLITLPLSGERSAFGTSYVDDGVSFPPGPNTTLVFQASSPNSSGTLTSTPTGAFNIEQKLTKVTILGVTTNPTKVSLQGSAVGSASWVFNDEGKKGELIIEGDGVNVDLNKAFTIEWT